MASRSWIEVTTLGDLLDQRASEHPDREAVLFPDERHTYGDLATRSHRLAKALIAAGVEQGDRVGYFLNEGVDTLGTLFASAKIGAICVPLNARFKPTELGQVIAHCGMKIILTCRPDVATDYGGLLVETFPQLAQAIPGESQLAPAPELRSIVALDRPTEGGLVGGERFLAQGDAVDDDTVWARQAAVRVRDTAVIMYTSGTTAMPKGAMLSHEAFCRFAAATTDSRMPIRGDDRVWTALPLFHIGGVAFAVATLYAGATFTHVGYFDATVALGQLRDEACTIALPGFETIWLPILHHPERAATDLASLRIVSCSGVEERLRQIQAATPHAVLVTCFGQTEACAFLSLHELDDPLEVRVTTGGRPLAGMECEIHDPDTDELLAPGNTGELWYRGPMAFDGYFRDPETNAAVFDQRGFFRTGDIVRMDREGRITFVSRVKDMLKVGGENVAAAEVEGYLITHPAVNLAQVVAAPDDKYVEVPAAFIELHPGATLDEQALVDYCRGKIATFRVPRYVRFIDDWPMSGTKIKKHVLRERIAAELAAGGRTQAPRITSS